MYCGRIFAAAEIQTICQLIAQKAQYPTRVAIFRGVCIALEWRQPNGKLKEVSCRVALSRMHEDGLICLPPPRHHAAIVITFEQRTGALERLALAPLSAGAGSGEVGGAVLALPAFATICFLPANRGCRSRVFSQSGPPPAGGRRPPSPRRGHPA